MPVITLRVPALYKKVLYVSFALAWLSGVAFYIFSRWVRVEGDFGLERHPWQFPVLQLHGAVAFVMLICFGAMLANHVPLGWTIRRLRNSGTVLVVAVTAQIVTAYILYYTASDEFREVVANVHSLTGFLLPVFLGCHIFASVRSRRRGRVSASGRWSTAGS